MGESFQESQSQNAEFSRLYNSISLIYFQFLLSLLDLSDCRSRGCEFFPARSNTFMEIDHEIIFTAILIPSAHSRRVVVSYKREYVREVLVNRLVKLAQQKKCG